MTEPAPGDYPMRTWVTVDGVTMPCTVDDLAGGQPTVLDGLTFTWGRESVTDQPDAGSCSFTIREQISNVSDPVEQPHMVTPVDWIYPKLNPYESWPDITNTGTSLLLTHVSGHTHLPSGDRLGVIRRSTDNGGTWEVVHTVGVADEDWGVNSIVQAADGAWIANATRNTHKSQGPPISLHTLRSTDDGVTWSEIGSSSGGIFDKIATTGKLIRLQNGDLLASWHGDGWGMVRSVDNGYSWTAYGTPNGGPWQREGRMVQAPDGTLVLIGRNGYLTLNTSADNGQSWTVAEPTGLVPEATATSGGNPTMHAMLATGDALEMVWMDRITHQIHYVTASLTDLITDPTAWGTDLVIGQLDGVRKGDQGYPAITRANDGTIALAYYEGDEEPSVKFTFIEMANPALRDVIHVGSNVEVWTRNYTWTTTESGTVPGPYRVMLAWAGEVTSLQTQAAGDHAINTAVVATDLSSELANARVGDHPWPVESIQSRANKIMALVSSAPVLEIDPTLRNTLVSYRDVDSQPPFDLLRDLATSAGGVLWITADPEAGAYLWMEDPGMRLSTRRFEIDPAGDVSIVAGETGDDVEVRTISACDVLRDPVTWTQDVSTIITQVAVSWLEQTTDEDGGPSTEEHTEVVKDTSDQIATYGIRNLDISTELISDGDAEELAGRTLAISRGTGWRFDGLQLDSVMIPDRDPNFAGTVYDLLDARMRIGYAVTIIDLPEWAPVGKVQNLYVDGGTYTWVDHRWQLELTVTPPSGQGNSATWADFEGTGVTWENFRKNQITWLDAYGTAGPKTGS